MKRIAMLVVVMMFSCLLIAQASAAKAQPIDQLSWLVGGVWSADISQMGGGTKRIETRYTRSDNGAFLRFNTHFIGDSGTANRYDGNFYWDPDGKNLAMWYMDAEGNILKGTMTVEGNLWTIEFRGQDFEGKLADLKVEVTRKNENQYHWALSESDGAKYKPLAALDYSRSAT